MEWQAKWLAPAEDMGDVAPLFAKDFRLAGNRDQGVIAGWHLGMAEWGQQYRISGEIYGKKP